MKRPGFLPKLPNRFEVQFDAFKKPTFWQRVRIMFGYNIVVRVQVRIDKRDARSWTNCDIAFTELPSEQAVIAQLQKQDIEKSIKERPANTI